MNDDKTFYSREVLEDALEDDEITPEEEGFMKGYIFGEKDDEV